MKKYNEDLANEQGLSDEECEKLEKLYKELDEMLEMKIEDVEDIEAYNDNMIALEFELQRTWHFNQDSDWHSWWFRDPKCTCPTLDNSDMVGTKYRTYTGDCPLHKITN